MASKLPVVKQVSFLSVIVQIIIILLLMLGFYQVDKVYFIYYSMGVFMVLFLTLRYAIPRYHRKGIALFKQHQFEQAIVFFQKSYDFFKKYPWVDKYRFLTILSSSRISYTESALLNEAFCLAQAGKKDESIAVYKKVLIEFPDSEMAKTALKMIE